MPRRSAIKIRMRRWIRYVTRQHGSPRQIAFGFAIGVFVAWTPTISTQMIIAGLLATFLGANRIAAIVAVYISNPFTMAPMYKTAQICGRYILAFLGIHRPVQPDPDLIEQELQYVEGTSIFSQTWDMLGRLARWGAEMWVGGIALGLISALVAYPIMVRLIEGHRLLMAQRRAKRWQKTWSNWDAEENQDKE